MRFNKILFLSIIFLIYFWYHCHKNNQLQNFNNEEQIFKSSNWSIALSDELPNVPFLYWENRQREMRKIKSKQNASCAPFPDLIEDVKYHNNYWQIHKKGEIVYYLYSAFYDNRELEPRKPVVRLLSMITNSTQNQSQSASDFGYCQLWFYNKESPMIVPVLQRQLLWRYNWIFFGIGKYFMAYLVTCAITSTLDIPEAVSLVNQPCDKATNSIKIHIPARTNQTDRKSFAVCVKSLNMAYEDYSARLVEWIELQRILGAHKVYMYELNIHPNIKRVLSYYQDEGFVELKPHSVIGSVLNRTYYQHEFAKYSSYEKRLDEIIVYNDCFYRHLYEYRYIAILDVDEALIPLNNLLSWQELIDTLNRTYDFKCPFYYNTLCFRHIYFPSNFNASLPLTNEFIPKFMHMLQYVQSVTNHSKPYSSSKCFHSTENVVAVHNHYPFSTLAKSVFFNIPIEYGQLQHYRFVHRDETHFLKASVIDRNIWRWKDQLITRTYRVLKVLKLLNGRS